MRYALKTLKWLLLAPLDFLVNTAAVLFFNWWVIFFARPIHEGDWLFLQAKPQWRGLEQKLPRFLSWFETFDASLDTGWIGGYFVPKGQYTPDNMPSYWKRKYYQWRWLNRNSAYSFSYYPLGIEMNKAAWTIHKYVRKPDTEGNKGYQLFIATSTEGYWNINLQGRYGTYKLGWKSWNYWDWEKMDWYEDNEPWGPEWRTTLVMSVNPFKRGSISEPALELNA